MRLKLLLSLLCVVWPVVVADEEYHNIWRETITAVDVSQKCFHDGYWNGTNCMCKPNFDHGSCQTRNCLNSGVIRPTSNLDIGCRCPPGFLGTSCEPVKCVAGESQSFYETQPEQTLALLITNNANLNKAIGDSKDDPVNAICQIYANSTYQYSSIVFGYGDLTSIYSGAWDVTKCTAFFNDAVDGLCNYDDNDNFVGCPGSSQLTLDQISGILDLVSPNSQIFIVTNTNLSSYELIQYNDILRRAISRRITLNVIAYAPPNPAEDSIYNGNTYNDFELLTQNTLGSYVTPYHAYKNIPIGNGTNKASDFMLKTYELMNAGFGLVSVMQAISPNFATANIGSGATYYVIVRTLDAQPYDVTFGLVATPPTIVLDTGYWRMYSGTLPTGSNVLSISMLSSGTNIIWFSVLAQQRLTSYAAVTTADSVDASTPYGILDAGDSSLVASVKSSVPIGLPVSATVWGPLFFIPNPRSRSDCQFSAVLGTINCKLAVAGVITIRDTANVGAAIPFMCVDPATIPVPLTLDVLPRRQPDFVIESQSDSQPGCIPGQLGGQRTEFIQGKRSFAIISRNVNDTSPDQSPIDQLYIRPNNVFDYLVPFMKLYSEAYSSFSSNLITDQGPFNTQVFDNFDDFITNVMGTVKTTAKSNAEVSNVFWRDALLDSLEQITMPFSDILVIIDSPLQINPLTFDVIQLIHSKRARIYFILVENFGPLNVDSQTMISYANLAARSGGTLLRVKDYTAVQNFFSLYFSTTAPPLFASDVVYHWLHPNPAPSYTTNTFYLMPNSGLDAKSANYLLVYGSNPVMSASLLKQDVTSVPMSPIGSYGEATIFLLPTITENNKYSLSVMFRPPLANNISLILLSSGFFETTNVAFTNLLSNDVDVAGVQFGYPYKQYPVMAGSNGFEAYQLTITNSSGKLVWSGTANNTGITRDMATCSYRYFFDFNWVCRDPDGVFYITTEAKSHDPVEVGGPYAYQTRTLLLTCASQDGQNACANGGMFEGIRCVCQAGFTGAKCESPLCQNNGTVDLGGKCYCTSGFQGDFCELAPLSMACVIGDEFAGPQMPDFRTELTSLLIIVERTTTALALPTFNPLPGVQIVVVQHGCGSANLVMSSTDISLLPAALQYPTAPCPSGIQFDSLSQAIKIALDAQLTDRALLTIFSSSNKEPSDADLRDILNRLAAQRVEVRFYTSSEQMSGGNSLIAKMGNGVPLFGNPVTRFGDYFTNYITPLYPLVKSSDKPPSRLVVVQSGDPDSANGNKVVIPGDPNDATASVLFVHLSGTDAAVRLDGAAQDADPTFTIGAGDGSINFIKIFNVNNNVGVTVTLSLNPSQGISAAYSVERMSTVKLAYGFQNDGINERLWSGLVNGNNTMSLYSTNSLPGTDVSNMPRINIAPISTNPAVPGDFNLIPTTKKTAPSCTCPFYTPPIFCDADVYGYQAQVITFTQSGIQRQEQKMLVCQSVTSNSTCVNGVMESARCVCIPNGAWEGLDCSLPVCLNGGTREGQACRCPPKFQGAHCEVGSLPPTELPPSTAHAFAFILDVFGFDDNLYNTSITALTEFISMYDVKTTPICVIDSSATFDGTFETDLPTIQKRISDISVVRQTVKGTGTPSGPDLNPVFKKILGGVNTPSFVLQLAITSEYNNIFFLTQGPANISTFKSLDTLKANNFTMGSIGFVYPFATFQYVDELSQMGTVDQADNWFDAVLTMRSRAGGAPYTPPTKPSTRQPSCVSGVQSNIYVALELSMTTNISAHKALMTNFLTLFPTDFNKGQNFNPTDSCSFDENKFKGNSLIAGWTFYDTVLGGGTSSFCPNNYNLVQTSVTNSNSKKDTPNWARLMPYIDFYLNYNCSCTRYNDANTPKYVIWMPITDTNATNADNIINSNWVHYVVPFFDVQPGGFYDALLTSNVAKHSKVRNNFLLNRADSYASAGALVQDLWTRICRDSGVITPDATAAPPVSMADLDQSDSWLMSMMQFQ